MDEYYRILESLPPALRTPLALAQKRHILLVAFEPRDAGFD